MIKKDTQTMADYLFKKNCEAILRDGFNSGDLSVRTVWEDGTPAHTLKTFGVIDTYDVGREFPALTLRKTPLKSAADELRWIYVQKSNKLSDLNSQVWDLWAKEDGTIGSSYGGVMTKKYPFKLLDGKVVALDQMDRLLYQLKNDPMSRRMIISLWQNEDLIGGPLEPCCFMTQWYVDADYQGKPRLNVSVIQRSQDMLAANNWNTCQYAIFLKLLAHCLGYEVGYLNHYINDCHIYDRHIPIVKELIQAETFEAPTVYINPELKNFYDFTKDDLIVEGYQASEFKHRIELAI